MISNNTQFHDLAKKMRTKIRFKKSCVVFWHLSSESSAPEVLWSRNAQRANHTRKLINRKSCSAPGLLPASNISFNLETCYEHSNLDSPQQIVALLVHDQRLPFCGCFKFTPVFAFTDERLDLLSARATTSKSCWVWICALFNVWRAISLTEDIELSIFNRVLSGSHGLNCRESGEIFQIFLKFFTSYFSRSLRNLNRLFHVRSSPKETKNIYIFYATSSLLSFSDC